MFLKQTAYKPRSGSQSSQGGQQDSSKAEAPKVKAPPGKSTDVKPGGNISAAAAGRRRSSAGQYASLQQYKRWSQDPSTAEKKAAWTEQKAGGTILSDMWHSFTKGS